MAYKLNHPDSDQEIEVDAEQVSLYVAQGWQTKPHAKPPAVVDVPPFSGPVGAFSRDE